MKLSTFIHILNVISVSPDNTPYEVGNTIFSFALILFRGNVFGNIFGDSNSENKTTEDQPEQTIVPQEETTIPTQTSTETNDAETTEIEESEEKPENIEIIEYE